MLNAYNYIMYNYVPVSIRFNSLKGGVGLHEVITPLCVNLEGLLNTFPSHHTSFQAFFTPLYMVRRESLLCGNDIVHDTISQISI